MFLCVANLSRFAQPAQLDLSEYDGMIPVEMLGYVEFPTITRQPYAVTLAPYGFLWLELHPSPETAAVQPEDSALLLADTADWQACFSTAICSKLQESILPTYLPLQRWFGNKSAAIRSTTIADWGKIEQSGAIFCLVQVEYETGTCRPLFSSRGYRLWRFGANTSRRHSPASVLSAVLSPAGEGVLYDATFDPHSCEALLNVIANSTTFPMQQGSVEGAPSSALRGLMTKKSQDKTLTPRRSSAEQSNTSILFGNRLIMKLFRHPEPGLNPDCEIGRFLTEQAHFSNIPPFGGSIEYVRKGDAPTTLCMLQGLVANQGDGWQWMLEELERYYENYVQKTIPAEELGQPVVSTSRAHGCRTCLAVCAANMQALRSMPQPCSAAAPRKCIWPWLLPPATQPSLPSRSTKEYFDNLQASINAQAAHAYELLRKTMSGLADDTVEIAALLLSHRTRILGRPRRVQHRQHGRSAHPHPRRLPSRPGAARQIRLRHSRL